MFRKWILPLAIATASLSAQSADLIDTLGPDNAYMNQPGWTIGHTIPGTDYASYSLFSPTLSGWASNVKAGVTWASGSQDTLKLELRADDGGLPGAVLAYGLVSFDAPGASISTQLLSAQLNQGVYLSTGQQYWFGIGTTDGSALAIWNESPIVSSGIQAYTGATFQAPGEWELVTGSAPGSFLISSVPNPPTAMMLALGLFSLALLQRRRMRG